MKEIEKHDPSKKYNLKENDLIVVCDGGYIIYQYDEDETKLNVNVRLTDYHIVYTDDSPMEFTLKELKGGE